MYDSGIRICIDKDLELLACLNKQVIEEEYAITG